MKKNIMSVSKQNEFWCEDVRLRYRVGNMVLTCTVYDKDSLYWDVKPLAKYLGMSVNCLCDLFSDSLVARTDHDEVFGGRVPKGKILSAVVNHYELQDFLEYVTPNQKDSKFQVLEALLNSVPETLDRIKPFSI